MTSWACDACLFISPQIARKKKTPTKLPAFEYEVKT